VLADNSFNSFEFVDAFKTWETQLGYPMIHVSFNEATQSFDVTQERFFANSEEKVEDERNWFIPLSFATQSNANFDDTTFTHFFDNGLSTFSIPAAGFDVNQWFVFNKQQLGVYRVNYDASNWNRIIATLNSDNYEQIHVLNRAQIVDDVLNFAITQDPYVSYEVAFGVLEYLKRETDYFPWAAAAANLDTLDNILRGQSTHANFQKFVIQLVKRIYAFYGPSEIADEPSMHRFARELAIEWMCRMGDAICLSNAYSQIQNEISQISEVPSSLQVVYYCNGMKGANKDFEFAYLWRKMQASTDQSERLILIDSLMCATESQYLYDLLETILGSNSETNYRAHETSRILNNVYLKSAAGIDATISFVTEYFEEIVAAFGTSMDSFIINISKRVTLTEEKVKIDQLLDKYDSSLQAATSAAVNKNYNDNQNWIASEKTSVIASYVSNFIAAKAAAESQLILPRTSAPTYYKIHLDVNYIHTGQSAYSGEVMIDVTINELTDYIMLHSKTQVIEQLHVYEADGTTEVVITDYSLLADTDTLTIYFLNELQVNQQIKVHIKYTTNLLTSSAYGFYRTSYQVNDEIVYLAATQFEPARARYAFPCYGNCLITHSLSFLLTFSIHQTSLNTKQFLNYQSHTHQLIARSPTLSKQLLTSEHLYYDFHYNNS